MWRDGAYAAKFENWVDYRTMFTISISPFSTKRFPEHSAMKMRSICSSLHQECAMPT